MPRKAETTSARTAWQWKSSVDARRSILDAARDVFAEHGFAEAGIAEVVERSGASVGSIYHHFGGKAELYLALWEDHQSLHNKTVASAVTAARGRGVSEPLDLFVIGTRTYLEGAWARRDLERVFLERDSPPGFEPVQRATGQEWMRQNGVLLAAGDEPVDRLTLDVLAGIIKSASREIVASPSEAAAHTIIDAAIVLIRKLMSDDEVATLDVGGHPTRRARTRAGVSGPGPASAS